MELQVKDTSIIELCQQACTPQIAKQVTHALQKLTELEYCEEIHNRSHTQFTWRHFVLNHKEPHRNLRQITAELSRKKQALVENLYKLKQKQVRIKIKERDYKLEKDVLQQELLQVNIDKMKAMASISKHYLEGAVKDVLYLAKQYEDLRDFVDLDDEKSLEEYEVKYWLKRLTAQSLRDIHSKGSIFPGNAEALEDIGINPRVFEKLLMSHLDNESKSEEISSNTLEQFLNTVADKYSLEVLDSIKIRGLKSDIVEDYLYLENKK